VLKVLKKITGERVDIHSVTLRDKDPYYLRIQAKFGVKKLPALIIAKPWPGMILSEIATSQQDIPSYCVVDDNNSFRGAKNLAQEVEKLVLLFAAFDDQQLEEALKNRKTKMLLDQVASRLGIAIGFLKSINVRFNLGLANFALSFDEKGVAIDASQQEPASTP